MKGETNVYCHDVREVRFEWGKGLEEKKKIRLVISAGQNETCIYLGCAEELEEVGLYKKLLESLIGLYSRPPWKEEEK